MSPFYDIILPMKKKSAVLISVFAMLGAVGIMALEALSWFFSIFSSRQTA